MQIILWLFLSVLCFQPDAQAMKKVKVSEGFGKALYRNYGKSKGKLSFPVYEYGDPVKSIKYRTPTVKQKKLKERKTEETVYPEGYGDLFGEGRIQIPNIGVEGFSETESPVDIQEYTEPKEQVPYQSQSMFGGPEIEEIPEMKIKPQSEPKMPSGKHHYHTSTSSFFKKAGALGRGYKKGSGKLFEKNMQGRKYSTEGVDRSSSEYWKLSREGRRELHQQKAVDIEQKLREISTEEQNKQLDLIEDLEKKENQSSIEFWIKKKQLDKKLEDQTFREKNLTDRYSYRKLTDKISDQASNIFPEKMHSVLRNEIKKLKDSYNETQQSLYNQMTTEKYYAEDFFTDLEEVGKQRKRLENLPEMRENLRQKELMERARQGVIYEGGALGELPVRRIKDEPSEREELSDLEKSQKSNQIFLNKEVSRHKRELRKQKKDIERYQQQEENPQQQSKRWYNPFTWR